MFKFSTIIGVGMLLAIGTAETIADTLSLCNDSGDTCIVKKMPNGPALGTFQNPIVDDYGVGDYRFRVHRGMYCANETWHRGYLRPWEKSPVIKPSCGGAITQISE